MQHHMQRQKASNFKLFDFILFVDCLFVHKLLALKATGVRFSTHLTGLLLVPQVLQNRNCNITIFIAGIATSACTVAYLSSRDVFLGQLNHLRHRETERLPEEPTQSAARHTAINASNANECDPPMRSIRQVHQFLEFRLDLLQPSWEVLVLHTLQQGTVMLASVSFRTVGPREQPAIDD